MNRHFDLIAIGGGSGGLAVAEAAAAYGRRVAVVEADRLGGTCVNNGCVPKKVMWEAARLAHAVEDAPGFGIAVERGGTDWRRLVEGRDAYIRRINAYWEGYVERLGVHRIRGHARFLDARTLEVDGVRYGADHIVVATGSHPLVPPVPGKELGLTSDGFFALAEQPERVAVIGGGYIGVELAGVLRALGSEVTLVTLEERVLERFDPMVSRVLEQEMVRQGIRLEKGFRVAALEGEPGRVRIRGADRMPGPFDCVIWAVGRAPNTRYLEPEAAGVATGADGRILVDDFQNTSVPGVYAIGDVTGRVPLTPVAIAAGRKLAARLFGGQPDARVDYDQVPSVVFAHPPVATLGLTEPEARARHDRVTVYRTEFTPMRHALSAGGGTTAMKLVCTGPEERVAGVHLVGDGVDEMLQGFAVAVRMGATKADFDRTLPIHPVAAEELVTLKAPVPEAAAEAA